MEKILKWLLCKVLNLHNWEQELDPRYSVYYSVYCKRCGKVD